MLASVALTFVYQNGIFKVGAAFAHSGPKIIMCKWFQELFHRVCNNGRNLNLLFFDRVKSAVCLVDSSWRISPKATKTQQLPGKVMPSVFWDFFWTTTLKKSRRSIATVTEPNCCVCGGNLSNLFASDFHLLADLLKVLAGKKFESN